MSPKKRLAENQGLPKRWRQRSGAYYYRVPPGQEHKWDSKQEFFLGRNLSEAYRVYADRIDTTDEIRSMQDLFDRYALEVIPEKAPSTQKNEHVYLSRLRKIFHDVPVTAVEPVDVYKLKDATTTLRGATTANHTVGVLSHVFTKAIEWGICKEHPIKGKVVKKRPKPTRNVPELKDIESALSCLTDKQSMLHHYVELKLMTGLRMTDMLSIKVSDIKDDGLHVTPSKTSSTTGKTLIIQFSKGDDLWETLEALKNQSKSIESFYLFSTREGQPYVKEDKTCNAFQSMWQRWQNKALKLGLIEKKFSEKSLRNRVGSDAESAEVAAELLAHSSTETTRKHYRNAPVKVQPMGNRLIYGKQTEK